MITTSAKIIIGIIGVVVAVVFGAIFYALVLPKNIPLAPVAPMQKQTTAITESFSESFSSNRSLDPLPTNQWYSSLLSDFPTQPLFALPIAYKLLPGGISFSYPDIKKTADTIFAPFTQDFTIGFDSDFTKPKIQALGDFSISLSMATKNNQSMSFTIGHGIPFTILHTSGKKVSINIPNDFQIYEDNNSKALASKSATLQTIVLVTRSHDYIISLDKKTSVSQTNSDITIDTPQKIFIGLLPSRDTYNDFKNIIDTEVTDTTVTPHTVSNTVMTNYHVTVSGKQSFIAVYPHQYDFLESDQAPIGTYQTLRGPLNLISTDSFTTKIPAIVPPDSFVLPTELPRSARNDVVNQIKTDIADVINTKQPDSQDYYLGTWFGKVDNLLLLTDTFGLQSEKNQLLQFVEPIFIKSLDGFSYSKETTSLTAKKPEFGNEKNNDHHFHYGYYIRTAAVLAKFDSSIIAKVNPQISEMISDIANTDRQNNKYPFLRHFDMYEGHSWADGYASFGDGNNQESSSEAMNAWYGVYLWSTIIHDGSLKNYALYLYNTEIQSTYYYWFDIKNIYSASYKHAMASIVWGGKVDFSTWFSAETNMKYGIQLLPFTPASDYLGKLSNFQKYEKDYHASGGDETAPWGDLFVMWQSFYSPKEATNLMTKVNKLEGNNTKAMMLYEVYKNGENGK